MINKEIILGNGNIVKDFSDRNIPQNSHNQVCVSFLIPSNQFNDYDDYSVFTAVSRVVGNVETPLNALVLTASKSITIEGINYIKFSCVLSLDYTNVLGELRFSPYIQATIHTDSVLDDLDNDDEDEVITETLLSQNSYTNCKLNIIKAVRIQEDASLEEASTATTLAGQINSKKIYYNAEWNSLTDASESMLYYNIATSYNPGVALYNGSIVAIKNQNVVSFYFPYLNGANVELFKMTNEGVFYKISGISRTGEGTEQSPYVYNATKQKLTYTKAEIDTKESAIYNALDLKVDKTQKVNGHALSGDITLDSTDVGLGNVANYGVESTPTLSGSNLYITSKGVYDALQLVYTAISGCATDEDLTTINNRLNAIESVIGDGTDDDNVINTLYEVIQVLNGLEEDANLLDLINAKANQSDFNTLNSQINGENGIATKVSFLYDSNHNAYAEIKAQSGTIDILTSDWVANTGDANYPYKWELSNGYLIGCSYASVVFDKDSDTSMIATSFGIDDENGKVIIYASELPSATISIQLIAIFNSVNAYELYNQTLVSQVNSNTQAISDINNTKLPLYLKQQYQYSKDGKLTTHKIATGQPNSSNISRLRIENEQSFEVDGGGNFDNRARLDLKTDTIQLFWRNGTDTSNFKNHELNIDADGFELKFYEKTSGVANTHTLTFDANGDLKVDGNAVGGGKTLYEHNIFFYASTLRWYITITNDTPTQMTFADLLSWLFDNNFKNANLCFKGVYQHLNGSISYGFRYSGVNTMEYMLSTGSMSSISNDGIAEFIDTVVAL